MIKACGHALRKRTLSCHAPGARSDTRQLLQGFLNAMLPGLRVNALVGLCTTLPMTLFSLAILDIPKVSSIL